MSRRNKFSPIQWLALAACVYIATASFAYRFEHPEQTETELLINLWKAITWK